MYERSFIGEEQVEVPGEVVIILSGEVASSLTASIPTMPLRGALSGVTAFGVDDVDAALAGLGVTDIARVHSPTPEPPLGFLASAVDDALASTFRIRFDPDRSLEAAVDALRSASGVETVEPVLLREALVTPNDPRYSSQWGMAKIRCPEAWDRTTGDPGVRVAVVDTGVDLDHPDLAPLILPGYDAVDRGPNPPPFQVQGQTWVWEGDFNGKDNVPQDEVGHGTHVAGTISALSNNNAGVAGVTWRCPIIPVKVLCRARRVSDGRISGFGFSDEIAEGIRWAADHGARVINLSLGSYGSTTVEANAVAYAIARGCVVVAAMGNDNTSSPSFPAAYPNVLAVAAIDAAEKRAGFSNTGAHTGVSAPGVGVQSTYWDNTYATANGTSMAAPHVAGVAALVLSCKRSLSEAQVRQVIRETARPLRDQPTDPVPNDRYGSGLVDARAAIDRACPEPKSLKVVDCGPQQSVAFIACLSQVINCNQQSILVRCVDSLHVRCIDSSQIRCLESTRLCPSVGVRCPDSRICRVPGFPADLEDDRLQGDDPFGARFDDRGGW